MSKIIQVIVLSLITNVILACTTFSFADKNGNIVLGRNFDFPVGTGHIEINKRNMRKIAFIKPPEKALEWISKYGSITFNQIGKEFPYGGINEAGLVIEQMWLQETVYPQLDERYGLSALQWIQYQLDNFKSVTDVINSDSLVRISFTSVSSLHFLVADAEGNLATIEYIDGKMIVHQGGNLPYPVLANCTYEHSLKYKESIDKNENKQFNDWTINSSGRFTKAASLIEDYSNEKNIVDFSFDILDSVAQQNGTQWSIVYDITNMSTYFKTSANPCIQKLEMTDFDFSCDSKNIFADISDTITGTDDFQEYSYQANFKLQEYVVSNVGFLRTTVPAEAIVAAAKYPETIVCADETKKTEK